MASASAGHAAGLSTAQMPTAAAHGAPATIATSTARWIDHARPSPDRSRGAIVAIGAPFGLDPNDAGCAALGLCGQRPPWCSPWPAMPMPGPDEIGAAFTRPYGGASSPALPCASARTPTRSECSPRSSADLVLLATATANCRPDRRHAPWRLRRRNADGAVVCGFAGCHRAQRGTMLAAGEGGLTPRMGGVTLAPAQDSNRAVIDQAVPPAIAGPCLLRRWR